MLTRSVKKPCFVMWMPSNFGTWSSTITRPIPALKPVSTGVEMKFATNPSRKSRADQQDRADERGERRGRDDELCRIAVGHDPPEFRTREYR